MTSQLVLVIVIAAVAVSVVVVALLFAARSKAAPAGETALLAQMEQVRGELRELSELFLVPRRRGAVGETLLHELLRSWLPEQGYELQFAFPNGTRADAVIRLGSRLVVVDSKYPQEAVTAHSGEVLSGELRRAITRHIGDIAVKYIQPDAGTMPFALMYVPSERIYLELFASRDPTLMQAALSNNVVPVSPSTLFVYVQTVAYGLRGLALSERSERLLKNMEQLQAELSGFTKRFDVAQTHLRNLSRAFDEAGAHLTRVDRAARMMQLEERESE
jgi:DNA recombination protein RmuC